MLFCMGVELSLFHHGNNVVLGLLRTEDGEQCLDQSGSKKTVEWGEMNDENFREDSCLPRS